MEPLIGNTVASTRIHDGLRISLRVDQFTLGAGNPVSKEIIEHPGSVVILPFTDDGQLLLIKQWRQAAQRILIEAPSGTREPGEDPLVTAKRELREETGYSAGTMTPLGGSWVAPGYSEEFTHAYAARDLHIDPLPQDEGEDIHTVMVPVSAVPDMIRSGELQDQMTIATYYTAMHVFREEVAQARPG